MKEREHYIDIAKGIAMLLVIIGHIQSIPRGLYAWVNSFHMPLFFILSGLVFNPLKSKDFKEFFKKKVKSLLIPYILLSFILWTFSFVISRPEALFTKEAITKFLGIFIMNRKSPLYLNLWFIGATFIAQILLYFCIRLVDKLTKKTSAKNIVYILLFFVFSFIGYNLVTKLPNGLIFNLDLVFVAMSYTLIGFIIRENKEKLNVIFKLPVIILYIPLHFVLYRINFKVFGATGSLFNSSLGNYFIYIFGAICGTFMIITLSKAIGKCKFFEYIGRNTLVFYTFQKQIALSTCYLVYASAIAKFPVLDNIYIKIPFCAVGALCICYIFTECINNAFPFIIGKRKEKIIEK